MTGAEGAGHPGSTRRNIPEGDAQGSSPEFVARQYEPCPQNGFHGPFLPRNEVRRQTPERPAAFLAPQTTRRCGATRQNSIAPIVVMCDRPAARSA